MKDEEDDSQEFYQEMEEQELAQLQKYMRGGRRGRPTRQPTQTAAMYKQALMDSIFGRFQEASRKLKLMISLSPDSPEPYHLLANMHQELGQHDKATEYLFMSTYLSPPSLQKWLKVAELSFDQRMYTQAAYCFGRALKLNNADPSILSRRAVAFEKAGQSRKAIATFRRLLKTSSSPQYSKLYAQLRYRKGEYALSRQILTEQEDYMDDSGLIHMCCQSYLKENNYSAAAELLEQHLMKKSDGLAEDEEPEELPIEFALVMLVCAVALKRQVYGFTVKELLEAAEACDPVQSAEEYSEAASHLSRHDPESHYKLLRCMLKHQVHQTIPNYVLATDYLCQQRQQEECLELLEEALERQPQSAELAAQQNYIHKFLGIRKGAPEQHFQEEIFYSDQDSQLPPPRTDTVPQEPSLLPTLLANNTKTLKLLLEQFRESGQHPFSQVLRGLDLVGSLGTTVSSPATPEQAGLFLKKTKRRRAERQSRSTVLAQHVGQIQDYFVILEEYLRELIEKGQYKRVTQVGERVSKVRLLRLRSRAPQLTKLKVSIYELSLIACQATRKNSMALFFLRFLTLCRPSDPLYSLTMHLLLRIGGRRTFLSSALSKRLVKEEGYHLARVLAHEYMETGCFELAVGCLLQVGQGSGHSLTPASQLALSVCLIQMASSRNVYNKLDLTNRSAVCLAHYQQSMKKEGKNEEAAFNRGRWLAQVRVGHKAVASLQEVLESEASWQLKQRAAYTLLNIYKDSECFEKCQQISMKYFALPQSSD